MADDAVSADSVALDQAIVEFLRAEAAGRAGNAQQWLERYPACAAGLAEFFNDRQCVDGLMTPARVVLRDPDAVPGLAVNDRAHDSTKRSGADTVDVGAKTRVTPDTTPLGQRAPGPDGLQTARSHSRQTALLQSTARYRPISFHARGGMGEVWLAEDVCVGRKVALKTLRPERYSQEARFVIEAQITGQLEHPNIVPLHGLGTDDAGRPFYVMKFIKGRKLSDAIAEFHAHKSSDDWSDELEFRRLLETFVSICNVIAYAHSKGVLHRDIKPDNVMLGAYGETLVVDWGLAKVIGQPEEVCHSYVRLSGGDSSATQNGAIIGTPLYMSPEGAAGRPEALDQANDVYLLGATLYEILTSKPPRQGSSSWELLHRARNTSPATPRKLDQRIPRPLEAVCMKGMAFEKEDRYETPTAMAEEIERYLAGAPTLAYREPIVARVGRWIRRHRRRIVRGLALLGVVLLCGLAVQSYRQAAALFAREQAREDLAEFYRLAEEAQYFAANTDAISERVPYYDSGRALSVGDQALAIAAAWGDQAQELPISEERTALLGAQYALLLRLAQINLQSDHDGANPHAAETMLDRAKAMHKPSRQYHRLRNRSLTLLGAHHAAEQEEDLATRSDTPVLAEDHFLQGELFRLEDAGSGAQTIERGDVQPSRDHLVRAIEEYRHALRLDPRHYWARFQFGRCLLALGRGPEAVEALSGCIAVRPDSPWAYTARGLANALSSRPDEALVDLDRAVLLDPDFQPARLNRGIVYWLQDNTDAARADFTAVLETPTARPLAEAALYRGQLLLKLEQDAQAAADFTTVLAARPDFRLAFWFRAKAQFRLGDFENGLADLKQFAELDKRQSTLGPADEFLVLGKNLRNMAQELEGKTRQQLLLAAAAQLQSALAAGSPTAEMWRQLGTVHELTAKSDDAIACYSKGLGSFADHVPLRVMRGWAYVGMKQYDSARDDFAEAVRLAPNDPEAHAGLGYALAELGRLDDARQEASAALLFGAQNQLVLHNVACIHGRLSETESERRIEHENLALEALTRASLLSRQNPIGPEADERALIRGEKSFPASLWARPELQRLLIDQ